MVESPFDSARRIARKYESPDPTIGVIPKGTEILARFHGLHEDGEAALVQRSADTDYAQFDNLAHPHAYGWHAYPLNTFKEIT